MKFLKNGKAQITKKTDQQKLFLQKLFKKTSSKKRIYNSIKKDHSQCETKEEHNDLVNNIIKDYNFPNWADAFLGRNRLILRNAHYSRKGSVEPTYSKIYINQIASAVNAYVWDLTYNMDETCIRLNSSSRIALAPT